MRPLRITRTDLSPSFQRTEIARVTAVLAHAVQPVAIFCFGSAAEGKATDQSDLDFLVVLDSAESFVPAREKLRVCYPLSTIPVDLVWKTRAEFLRLRELGGVSFVAWQQGRNTYCRPGCESEMLHDQETKV